MADNHISPMATSAPSGRKRARLACRMCHELKRKCDGHEPCSTCVRYEYDCEYTRTPRGGKHRRISITPSLAPQSRYGGERSGSGRVTPPANSPVHDQTRSLEANSGAAFLRRVALNLDANDAPRLHTFAWNAFLGSRKLAREPRVRDITEVLLRSEMQRLVEVYFRKVDTTYGFMNRDEVQRQVESRWLQGVLAPGTATSQDAVLLGIAALGCLYTQPELIPAELDLAESARVILEHSLGQSPTVASITAWTLRVMYLRFTDIHHTAWLASCILMHMIEAASLHWEPSSDSVLQGPLKINLDQQRRIVAVAQHLNIWMSYDMGRSRVVLCNATVVLPSARPGDYTLMLMELLPYSAQLDPEKSPSASDLQTALSAVLARSHSNSPSVLGQVNLAICLCRRLQSMGTPVTGSHLTSMLDLTTKGIMAAREACDDHAPWHHMANVPFQIICLLLSIDTHAATAQIADAMKCLAHVAKVYRTEATAEALQTASLLILLYKRRKESRVGMLDEILREFPAVDPQRATNRKVEGNNTLIGGIGFEADLEFDWGQFLVPAFLKDQDFEYAIP